MTDKELPAVPPDQFTVVTWNILLDKTRTRRGLMKPQSERIASQAETLARLGLDLDVVAIQEAEKTKRGHNGVGLATALGFQASFWYEHNTAKRKGEHIGMFGNFVETAESFEVGHDKKAVITTIGEVAIAAIHHRNELWGQIRTEQMLTVADRLRDFEHAIVLGDTNALFFEKSRRILYCEGFRSAFHIAGQKRPTTYPTGRYKPIMQRHPEGRRLSIRQLLRGGVSLDDIYVKNLGVFEAGSFEGDSDHVGLWATIGTTPA